MTPQAYHASPAPVADLAAYRASRPERDPRPPVTPAPVARMVDYVDPITARLAEADDALRRSIAAVAAQGPRGVAWLRQRGYDVEGVA